MYDSLSTAGKIISRGSQGSTEGEDEAKLTSTSSIPLVVTLLDSFLSVLPIAHITVEISACHTITHMIIVQ